MSIFLKNQMQSWIAPKIKQDLPLIFLCWVIASGVWLFGGAYIPYDSIDEFFPQSHFVVESILRGNSPWWNPFQFSGIPVFGDPQSLVFSLHTIVGLIAGSNYSLIHFDFTTLLHPLFGGLAIYQIGYSKKTSRPWLILAVLVFILGGVSTSRLQHVVQIISYSWIPVLLLLQLRIYENPKLLNTMLLGVCGAIWASNPNQVVFLGGIFLLLNSIYLASQSKQIFKLSVMYALAGLVAGGLVLPMYLAMFDIVNHSSRAILILSSSKESSLPVFTLFSMIFPSLFNGGKDQIIWSPTDVSQDYFYIGIIPLGILIFGFISHRFNLKSKIWLIGLVVFIFYAIGLNSPFYPFLFNHVYGFSFFRRPADAGYLINILMALGFLLFGKMFYVENSGVFNGNSSRKSYSDYIVAILVIFIFIFYLIELVYYAFERNSDHLLLRSVCELLFRLFAFLLLIVGLKISSKFLNLKNTLFMFMIAIFVTIDMTESGRRSGPFVSLYSGNERAQMYGKIIAKSSLNSWLNKNTFPWARVEIIGGEKSMGDSSWGQYYNTQGYNPVNFKSYFLQLGSFFSLSEPRYFPKDSAGIKDLRYNILGLKYVAFHKQTLLNLNNSLISLGAIAYKKEIQSIGGRVVFDGDGYEVWERPGTSYWLSMISTGTDELVPATCDVIKFQNTFIELSCDLRNSAKIVVGEIFSPNWIVCVNDEKSIMKPYFDIFRSFQLSAGKSAVKLFYKPFNFFKSNYCS